MAPEVKALVDRMQGFYERTQDFTGDFKQEYHYKTFNRTGVSTGTVAFQKPARMRWEYLTPSKRSFVLSRPHLRARPRGPDADQGRAPTSQLSASVTFLWGKGKLSDEFDISRTECKECLGTLLTLVPKKPDARFREVQLDIDPKDRPGPPEHRHRSGREQERHHLLQSEEQRRAAEGDFPAHAAARDADPRHDHDLGALSRGRHRWAAPMLLALALGCAHASKPDVGAATVTLTLRSGPGLPVEGTIGGAVADVRIAIEEPRSLLSKACPGATVASGVQVRLPLLQGGWETLPEVPLAGVSLGGHALPAFRAAVVQEPACVLWLGLDVLGQSVVDVDSGPRDGQRLSDAPELAEGLEQAQVDVTARRTPTGCSPRRSSPAPPRPCCRRSSSPPVGPPSWPASRPAAGAESVRARGAARSGLGGVRRGGAHADDWTRAPAIGVLGPRRGAHDGSSSIWRTPG
jgi:hypothetical protein